MVISEATYCEMPIQEFVGNLLIEALPNIKLDIMENFDAFFNYNSPDESVRNLPEILKQFKLNNIQDFYFPFSWHLLISLYIDNMIREGYRYRNPLDNKILSKIYEIENHSYDSLPIKRPSPTFALIGVSGIGKTSAVSRKLQEFPRIIQHSNYHGYEIDVIQIPYLWIEAPFDGSVKSFCFSFLSEIDSLLDTNYVEQYKRCNTSTLQNLISKLCWTYNVGLIVIDEIQSLLNAKRTYGIITDFLNSLSNKLQIPLLFIGTPAALALFDHTLYLCRRMGTQGVLILNSYSREDSEWNLFIQKLWYGNQYTKTKNELTPEIENCLYKLTGGIPAFAVALYTQVQVLAFFDNQNNDEIIDAKALIKASEELSQPLKTLLDKLQEEKAEHYSVPDYLPDKTIVKKIKKQVDQQIDSTIAKTKKAVIQAHILETFITFGYTDLFSQESLEKYAWEIADSVDELCEKREYLSKAISFIQNIVDRREEEEQVLELEKIEVGEILAHETEIF